MLDETGHFSWGRRVLLFLAWQYINVKREKMGLLWRWWEWRNLVSPISLMAVLRKGHLSLKRHANLIALLLPPKPAAKIVELTDLLYSGHHGWAYICAQVVRLLWKVTFDVLGRRKAFRCPHAGWCYHVSSRNVNEFRNILLRCTTSVLHLTVV